jgi:hypothetical protein
MLRFQRKGLQDEQIQRSLWKVDTVRFGHALPFRFYKKHTRSLVEVQGGNSAGERVGGHGSVFPRSREL